MDAAGRWQAAVDAHLAVRAASTGTRSTRRCWSASTASGGRVGDHGVRRRRPPLAAVADRAARGAALRTDRWCWRARRRRPTWYAARARRRRARRAATCCRSGAGGWSSRCRLRGGPRRTLAADPGTYANIAAVTASVDGTLTPTSPVHIFVNPEVFDDLEPVGGAGRDEPRGHPRGHRSAADQRDAAVAARGVRRLRRPARRRPADHDDREPDHRSRSRAAAHRATCPGQAEFDEHAHPPRARRTRAPGWPAGCSPTRAARRLWCVSTERSPGVRTSTASCAGRSA